MNRSFLNIAEDEGRNGVVLSRRVMKGIPTRTWLRLPLGRLIAILVAVVLIDAIAASVAFTLHRNDPPPLPSFAPMGITAPLRLGVDSYTSEPQAFGFTTTFSHPRSTDESGRVRLLVGGREVLDPDASLRFAIAALAEHNTSNDTRSLARARTAVMAVLATNQDGLIPHQVPGKDQTGRELPRGWVSAQTQGLLLSVLSRLYTATRDSEWRASADQVFDTMLRARGSLDNDGRPYTPWISLVDEAGFLWFDEFPQSAAPSYSMTPHLFAVIGVYDYAAITEGSRHAAAINLFAAAASTGQQYIGPLRSENAAAWTSPAQLVRSWELHQVLVAQLSTLTEMTSNATYRQYTQAFRHDTAITRFATTGFVLSVGVDAYSQSPVGRLPPTSPAPPPGDRAGSERNAVAVAPPDVALATAINALAEYSRTNDRQALNRAETLVGGLMETTQNGLVPHDFEAINPAGQTLVRPWFSAQTQGLLLSALVRLEAVTGSQRWADDAGAVFSTLRRTRNNRDYSAVEPRPIWTSFVGDNKVTTNLWFEKYWRMDGPNYYDYPSMVVDAHIAALIGVYDYWGMTKDPAAARLFDGGATSLLSRLPDIRRNGGVSETALSWGVFQLDHHRVVTEQLSVLAQMTGDRRFDAYSRLLAKDAS